MSKIDGTLYYLEAFNSWHNYSQLREIANSYNKKEIRNTIKLNNSTIDYKYRETDKNAPCRIKKATKSQENWKEIRTLIEKAESYGGKMIYLLWLRKDIKENGIGELK